MALCAMTMMRPAPARVAARNGPGTDFTWCSSWLGCMVPFNQHKLPPSPKPAISKVPCESCKHETNGAARDDEIGRHGKGQLTRSAIKGGSTPVKKHKSRPSRHTRA